MSELSFEQMLEESLKTITKRERLSTGTVIDVKEDEIILNIGYKSDGILTKKRIQQRCHRIDLTTVVQVGDDDGSKSSESKRRRRTGCC